MSIASEITRLYGVRGDIFTAIDAKGVTVPSSSVLDDAPELIAQIQIGGGAYLIDYTNPTYGVLSGPDCSRSGATITPSVSCAWGYGLDYFTVNGTGIPGETFTMPAVDTTVGAVLKQVDPLNPLGLPSHTLRIRFTDGYTPTQGTSRTQVSSSPNIWDITNTSNSWYSMFESNTNVLEVLGVNSTGVTDMYGLFHMCYYLEATVPFDVSSVTNAHNMYNKCRDRLQTLPSYNFANATKLESWCNECRQLTSVGKIIAPKCTNFQYMGYYCVALKELPEIEIGSNITGINVTNMWYYASNVEDGITRMYNTLNGHCSSYSGCFRNCGSNTTSGSAQLANIPSGWK